MMLVLPKQLGDSLFAELQIEATCEPLPKPGTRTLFNNDAGTELIYTAKQPFCGSEQLQL